MGRVEIMNYREDGQRWLDIGPGWSGEKMPGFETLDIEKRDNIDHVADAAGPLPFEDNTFDLIHASHILEHIPWQYSEDVLKEWVRVLKPGGTLEIWVPNGEEIVKGWLRAEKGKLKRYKIPWRLWRGKKVQRDPCRMMNGLIISFKGINFMPWGIHKAIFNQRYLKKIMLEAGLSTVESMTEKDLREVRPGVLEVDNWIRKYEWFNLGVRGIK
jgi:SAM-dependent methyltransferase